MVGLPSIQNALQAARIEFQERVQYSGAYTRRNNIDLDALAAFNGGWGLVQIAEFDGKRFDFNVNGTQAFILEAYDEDGESIIDFVGWSVDEPENVLTMFGRVGLLGSWTALGPATYFMGGALTLHKTPLDWLQSGCQGAVIVTPSIAAHQLARAPGSIAAQDHAHGRQLVSLLKTVLHPEKKIVVPSPAANRSAA